MLVLKEQLEKNMREYWGISYNHDFPDLLFALPHLKIDLLQKKNIVHRQTASLWLGKLAEAKILERKKLT